jgi:hypothetical protein
MAVQHIGLLEVRVVVFAAVIVIVWVVIMASCVGVFVFMFIA